MKRLSPFLLTILLGLAGFSLALAQEAPATTPEPPNIDLPPGAAPLPTAVGGFAPSTNFEVSPFAENIQTMLTSARQDLELLALREYGGGRPMGWSGSTNIYNEQLPIFIRLDLELLAGALIAPDQRPEGWFGALTGTSFSIARDIRHDLELLADTLIQKSVRPPGWTGSDPLLRCDRATQSLVYVLERSGIFTLDADPNQPDFCQNAMLQASSFADINLLDSNATLSLDPLGGDTSVVAAPITGNVQVDSDLAIVFLNRYGTEQVGRVPRGAGVQPLARSFAPFSRMMLVRGANFTVYMDYRDTTLTAAQFASLPDIDQLAEQPAACNAAWCTPVVYTLGNPASRRGG